MLNETLIKADILIPLFVAFAISVALSPIVIPFLTKLKVGRREKKAFSLI